MKNDRSIYIAVLMIVSLMFFLRVVAQLIQWLHPVEFLPQFGEWQSGVLPYSFLLSVQILILVLLMKMVRCYLKGSVKVGRQRGMVFLLIGCVYFLIMAARLFASIYFNKDDSWFFDGVLASFFHVILSCFLITHGHYVYQNK